LTVFNEALNQALGSVQTAARWDTNNGAWMSDVANFAMTAGDVWAPVSPTNPMPINDASSVTALASILAKQSSDPATQTTLAAILAKMIAAPSTEAKQDNIVSYLGDLSLLHDIPLTDLATVLYAILARSNAVLTFAHTTASITTASALALASNASRKYALLINNHSMPIYIKVGSAAVLNQGIRLEADGGVYEMKLGENLATGAIYAITESGVGSLLVTEGI